MAKVNLAAALQNESQEETEVLAPAQSLIAVKPKFQQYVTRVDEMVIDAKAIEVTDEETLKFAVALGGEAKKITKTLDAQRKDVTAEASDFVKSVNGFVKIFTDKLTDIETVLKKKIGAYQEKIELDRRKQQELSNKATEQLQQQVNKEAAAAGVEAPIVPAAVIPQQKTVTRTETGTTAFTKKPWKHEIINPEEVPREFCVPSDQKIRDAIKQGVRNISGVRIFEDTQVNFRT